VLLKLKGIVHFEINFDMF